MPFAAQEMPVERRGPIDKSSGVGFSKIAGARVYLRFKAFLWIFKYFHENSITYERQWAGERRSVSGEEAED